MSSKLIWTLTGFFLFIFGVLSLILLLVGMNLSFLTFIDVFGRTPGLVIRLLMVMIGVVLIYAGRVSHTYTDIEESANEDS